MQRGGEERDGSEKGREEVRGQSRGRTGKRREGERRGGQEQTQLHLLTLLCECKNAQV